MTQEIAKQNLNDNQKSTWEAPKLIEINEGIDNIAGGVAPVAEGFATSTS